MNSLKLQGIIASATNGGAVALSYVETVTPYVKLASLLIGVIIGILTVRKYLKEW